MARISIDPAKLKADPRFDKFRSELDWDETSALGLLILLWDEGARRPYDASCHVDSFMYTLARDLGINTTERNQILSALESAGFVDILDQNRFIILYEVH